MFNFRFRINFKFFSNIRLNISKFINQFLNKINFTISDHTHNICVWDNVCKLKF